jgi:hypothetical protein
MKNGGRYMTSDFHRKLGCCHSRREAYEEKSNKMGNAMCQNSIGLDS